MKETIDVRLGAIVDELLDNDINLSQAIEAFEKKFVMTAFDRKKGSRTKIGKILGLHRNSVLNLLKRHGAVRLKRTGRYGR